MLDEHVQGIVQRSFSVQVDQIQMELAELWVQLFHSDLIQPYVNDQSLDNVENSLFIMQRLVEDKCVFLLLLEYLEVVLVPVCVLLSGQLQY